MDQTRDPESPLEPADWELLARYAAGECDADERARVQRWLAERPEGAALLATLEQATSRLTAAPPDVDTEAALRRVRARIAERASPDVRPLVPERAPSRYRGWSLVTAAVAAVVILVAGLAVWRARPGAPAALGNDRILTTAVGQRDSTTLPDGSRVILGPDSRLNVAAGYGGRERVVDLEGEAWFQVRHDPTMPFAVRVSHAIVRDVGTTFTVNDAGGLVRVAVSEGVVSVARTDRPDPGLVLAAGDRGEVGPAGRITVQRGGATDEDAGFTRGRLVFRDASMDQLAADLRRWYGVELRVPDSALARRHVTASFDREPASTVTRAIALALGARVTQRGDTVILQSTPTTPR